MRRACARSGPVASDGGGAGAAHGLVVGTAPAAAAAEPGPFPDVPADSTFAADISWLVERGIARGYEDGTFRPAAPVTRQAFAAYLHRYSTGASGGSCSGETSGPRFPDVPASSPFCQAVAWLAASGVTAGYDDGTFRPSAVITRQAIAAFLYRLWHGGEDGGSCLVEGASAEDGSAAGTSPFRDVPVSSPFCVAVTWLTSTGPVAITNGYADGTFRPAGPTSRQATAAFLRRYATAFPAAREEVSRVLAEGVIDLDEGTVVEAVREPAGAVLTLAPGAAVPSVGDELVVDPTGAVPGGTAGRVLSVEQTSTGAVVRLQEVVLEELFDALDVGYTGPVDVVVEDLEAAGVDEGGMRSFTETERKGVSFPTSAFACEGDRAATWDARLDFERTWVDFDAGLGRFKARPHARLHLSTEPVIRVTGAASASTTCTLTDTWRRRHAVKWVVPSGPVPLTFTLEPYVQFTLSADGTVEVRQRFLRTLGVGVRLGEAPSLTSTGEALDPEVDVDGDVAASLRLGADLSARLYDVVGVFVTVGPRLDASVRTAARTVGTTATAVTCVDLSATVESKFGMRFDAWVPRKDLEIPKGIELPPWQLASQCTTGVGAPDFGTPVPLAVTLPGGTTDFVFRGRAGERIGAAVTGLDLPEGRDLSLRGPDGVLLEQDSVLGGAKPLSVSARLPVSGTYRLVLDLGGDAVAEGVLHVSSEAGVRGAVDAQVGARLEVARPGQTAAYVFGGAAGQRVGVALSGLSLRGVSDFHDLSLFGPDGKRLESGYAFYEHESVISFSALLPSAGEYRLVFDPADDVLGGGPVHVSGETVSSGAVGGPGVLVETRRPGQTAALTFAGQAGQTVTARLTDSTLPADAGRHALVLYAPDGTQVTSAGSSSADAVLEVSSPLTVSGTYRLVLDPGEAATGGGVLSLTEGGDG